MKKIAIAYVHTKCRTLDDPNQFDTYCTQQVPCRVTELPFGRRTTTGYGKRVVTEFMIYWEGHWRRVYRACFSNAGTLFIGPKLDVCLTVGIDWVDAS